MKNTFRLFLLTFIVLVITTSVSRAQDCWQLVWADEFDYTGAPAPENWGYDLGGGGWGNNEVQNYTNSLANSWVEDSVLNIKAIKSSSGWTSARLITKNKMDILYGRIEVRAKLPVGRGTWPAIWTLPTDWIYGGWPKSGEVDIMEHVGYDPGRIHASVHTEAYNHSIGTQVSENTMVPDFATNFHTYKLEWSETFIKMYIDDYHYFTFFNDGTNNYKTWPFNQRFHLLLNIAIGGNWGGQQGIDPNLTQALMQIDYVKVYSKTVLPKISGPISTVPLRNLTFKVPDNPEATYQWTFPQDVTILNGAGTATVNVKWGETAGEVKAVITTACGTVTTPVHSVTLKNGPSGDLYFVPTNPAGTPAWYPITSNGNQITLSESDTILKINYNVTMPATMPAIGYDFPMITDFSGFSFFGFKFKAEAPNNPHIVRLDLIDYQNRTYMNNPLVISNPVCDGNYHTYLIPVASAVNFDLSSVKKMKLQFNYGVYGTVSSGEFTIKDVFFSVDNSLSIPEFAEYQIINLFPNPTTGIVNLPGNLIAETIVISNMAGASVKRMTKVNGSFSVEGIHPGIYLVTVTHEDQTYLSRLAVQ